MREKVEAALEKIRQALRADGGDVELVDVKDGTVIGPINIGDESRSDPTLFNAAHSQKPGVVLIEKRVVDAIRRQIADITGADLPSSTTATRERMTERRADRERAAVQNRLNQ